MNERFQQIPRISDRILLHLFRYYGRSIDVVAPWALTQEGIANNIGVDRKNVVIPLKKLSEDGLISILKRHVKGSRTIRKIYMLEAEGVAEANELLNSFGDQLISIIDLEGYRKEVRMKDVRTFLTTNTDLLDIMLAVRDEIFDCKAFQHKETRLKRKLVDMTERMPIVREFFGRVEELEELRKFVNSNTSKVIVISGIPGIGKTALISAFVLELKKAFDVFWYRIHEWTGLRGLLTALGEFLSAQGKSALLRYLESSEAPDLEKVGVILRSDLSNARGIAVFDDFHKGDTKMTDALRVIFQIIVEEDSEFRLIVIGREISHFYDIRDIVVRKTLNTIVLGALDVASSRKILQSREILAIYHDDAIAMAQGHPLFLELFEPTAGFHPSKFIDFLEKEIYVSLNQIEQRIMTIAAIARYPLLPDAYLIFGSTIIDSSERDNLKQMEEEIQTALIYLREKNLLFDVPYGAIGSHDLLKEFFAKRASPKLCQEIHTGLARYYSDDDSSFSAAEAIYHFTMAGDLTTAFEIANVYTDEIISRGGLKTLENLLDTAISTEKTHLYPNVFLLKAKVEEAKGDWNSALTSIESALESDIKLDENRLIEIMRLRGYILLRKGYLDRAKKMLTEASDYAKKVSNDKLLAFISCDLGNLFHKMGMLDQANISLNEALQASDRIGDGVLKGRVLYGIGKLIAANEDFEGAIKVEEEALEILRQTGSLSDQAKVLVGLGLYHDATDQYEIALNYHDEAFTLATRAGDVVTKAYALANSASTLISMRMFEKSKKRIEDAREVFTSIDDKNMLSMMSLLEGKIFATEENWEDAESCFQKCTEIARESGQIYHLVNWYIDIANTYESIGKNEAFITNLEQALSICRENSLSALQDHIEKRIKGLGRGVV